MNHHSTIKIAVGVALAVLALSIFVRSMPDDLIGPVWAIFWSVLFFLALPSALLHLLLPDMVATGTVMQIVYVLLPPVFWGLVAYFLVRIIRVFLPRQETTVDS